VRIALIINPAAGGDRPRYRVNDRETFARAWLAGRRVESEISVTRGRGHAAELSRSYVERGFARVVAWGGDGTLNEAAGPLVGTPVVFGLIPGGSGNGFARGLGVPRHPVAALEAATSGGVRRVDVGWLGTRHFLNVGGVGFDGLVARAFDGRRGRGVLGYLTAGTGILRSYQGDRWDLEIDGAALDGTRRFLVAFANGSQYGNGLVVAPDADLTDGRLDAVIVDAASAWRQVWRAARLFVAPAAPIAGITRVRLDVAVVRGGSLPCHVDGEPFEWSGPLAVRVEGGALCVAVPLRGRSRGV
jgi:diacylglycerol kinase family enzyme